MNPDELQQVWQTQTIGRRLTINADLLLQQVERSKKSFEAMILCRDVREVGVAFVLVPVWIWLGIKLGLPWTWWLCIPALLWIAGFMMVDRVRQRRRQPGQGEPLRTCIQASLTQVEHQIWLLRNVLWWYLLPLAVAVLTFFSQSAWSARDSAWDAALRVAGPFASTLLVGWFVYWLNQYTVRKELEPRQRELQSLLASLDGNEPAKEPPRDGSTSDPRWRDVLRIVLGLAIGAAIAFLVYQLAASEPEAERTSTSGAATSTSAYGDAAVTNVLISVLKKHDMPAMAAAVVTGKESSIVGVAGTRKRGTEIAATLDDKWHLGSDGKAMTATLVARLVEKDRLKWDTTLAQVFPDLADKFHPDFRTVTVLQLLQHRSGLPENPKLSDYWGADGQKERQRLVQNELAKRPKNKPGEEYEYSNLGYAIVGAITEKITGKSWEQTMRDEVFGPLGMNSVGFGGTGTPGQIDQPWGHSENGRAVYKNGPEMDNPPALSPAGRVHCTIQDWAKFVTDHLRGARGEPALLKASSYVTLHTPPPGGRYACGWAVSQRNWAGGTTLHHTGDNTMNVANVWIAPKRDFAVLVCVNQTGDKAFKASDDAIGQLIQLHSKGGQ